jgi:hypothetical protein
MTRVEFKLAMPNKGSWDNKWSGESRNYTLVKELDDDRATQLDGRSWSYGWPDGWRAEITARLVHEASTLPPSHGFHGYDWMVESILRYDTIYADHEQPEAAP